VELDEPVGERGQPEVVVPAPERRVERGHVVQEAELLVERDGVVTGGDQVGGRVAHQQRGTPAVATEPGSGTDDGVVEARWQRVEQAALPHGEGPGREVARAPHDPVVVDVEVLDDMRLAVDQHPLERRSRPRVGGRHDDALRVAHELLDRRGHGPGHELRQHLIGHGTSVAQAPCSPRAVGAARRLQPLRWTVAGTPPFQEMTT